MDYQIRKDLIIVIKNDSPIFIPISDSRYSSIKNLIKHKILDDDSFDKAYNFGLKKVKIKNGSALLGNKEDKIDHKIFKIFKENEKMLAFISKRPEYLDYFKEQIDKGINIKANDFILFSSNPIIIFSNNLNNEELKIYNPKNYKLVKKIADFGPEKFLKIKGVLDKKDRKRLLNVFSKYYFREILNSYIKYDKSSLFLDAILDHKIEINILNLYKDNFFEDIDSKSFLKRAIAGKDILKDKETCSIIKFCIDNNIIDKRYKKIEKIQQKSLDVINLIKKDKNYILKYKIENFEEFLSKKIFNLNIKIPNQKKALEIGSKFGNCFGSHLYPKMKKFLEGDGFFLVFYLEDNEENIHYCISSYLNKENNIVVSEFERNRVLLNKKNKALSILEHKEMFDEVNHVLSILKIK